MNKNDQRLGRRMLAVYQESDAGVAAKAEKAGTTCKKGCASCCHLLISTTFPEAVAVAEHVQTEPKFKLQKQRILKRLHEQVELLRASMARQDPMHYFRAKLACPFLDTSDQTCGIYKARPSSCRLHHAVSDPENCAPDSGKAVERLDVQDEAVKHLNEAYRVSRQAAVPLWSGPFPIMLLWAFKLLTEGRQAVEQAHATEDPGLLSLNKWRLNPPTQGNSDTSTITVPHE